MVTLESILHNYFGCDKTFNENGEPTTKAKKSASKLLDILYDCEDMGLCTGVSNGEEEIELILGVSV